MEKYQFIKKLAESPNNCVSLAESKLPLTGNGNSTGTNLVVIKEIPFNDGRNMPMTAVFSESKILATLSHPNIVKLVDTFINKDTLCIVTEYCEGGDLATHLHNGSIRPKDVQEIFIQLLLALKYLHDRNIIHRDLKLRNIFVTSRNNNTLRIKIGDFGIAKQLESNKKMATTMIGTPLYLSPELCSRQPYDKSTDVWCLGCVLYELLNFGKHPFNGKDMADLFGNIQEQVVDYSAIIDLNMVEILKRLFLKDGKRRPTVDEILLFPNVQDYIQEFVSKINGNKPFDTPPPTRTAFSNTSELLTTMQTMLKAPEPIQSNPVDTMITAMIREQIRQGTQCGFFKDVKDLKRLEKEIDRVWKRLAQILLLPSHIQKYLEILKNNAEDPQVILKELTEQFDPVELKDLVESQLIGDSIVMIKIQTYLREHERN